MCRHSDGDVGYAEHMSNKDALLDSPEAVRGVALVLGSEGQGVSPETVKRSLAIGIPMSKGCDSLNASQAGAILMFMLSKGFQSLNEHLYGASNKCKQ